MLLQSLAGLPTFLAYFAVAVALLTLFGMAYIFITPYREIQLIRQGNVAAALGLGGALLGFVLPLASAIAHSVSLLDMAVWGLIALLVQLLVYRVACGLAPELVQDIPAGKVAAGTFVATLSVVTGILNAACMTY